MPDDDDPTTPRRSAMRILVSIAAVVLVALAAVSTALLVDIRNDMDAVTDAVLLQDGVIADGIWVAVHSEQRPVLRDGRIVYSRGSPPKTAAAAPTTTTTSRPATTTTSRPAPTTARRTTTTRGVTQAQCNQLETWALTTAVAFELMLADVQATDFDGIAVTYPQVRDQMSQASTMRSRISACHSGSERTELLNSIDLSIREWRSIQSTCRESFDWLIDRC